MLGHSKNSSTLYSGGSFDDYKEGDIESFKNILMTLISNYLKNHTRELEQDQAGDIELLLTKLKASHQYSAVYTHLSIAKVKLKELATFSILIDDARDYPRFGLDVLKMKEKTPSSYSQSSGENTEKPTAVYHNSIEAAVFESELAHALLTAAPTESLEKINQAIIDYLSRHRRKLLAEKEPALKEQLIKYHLCASEDFHAMNAIDKFIELLKRPLTDTNNLSEFATLHLVFFNYEHIYDPALDVKGKEARLEIEHERQSINRRVRPNKPGEMFEPVTRGRQGIFANIKTKEFGITDPENTPDWGREWHRNPSTPHKYRSGLNLHSPVLKSFRSHGIPYIAGPSGTSADCAEGLHFLMPGLSQEEKQEYFNLLAAAEIAQGHHSMHEIILPLCNLELYKPYSEKLVGLENKKQFAKASEYRSHPWAYLDYQKSYEEFLSPVFKKTSQYHELCHRYPQYLDPDRLIAEPVYAYLNKNKEKQATLIQRFLRARKNYTELDKGSLWKETALLGGDPVNLKRFKKLSNDNVKQLEADLDMKSLTLEEKAFMRALSQQTVELAHYTNAAGEIFESGLMLSNTSLKKMFGDGYFTDNSAGDIAALANGENVFFRYELTHQTANVSRFGDEQIILNAEVTPLFQTGWISLYEMLKPSEISIVKELVDSGEILRSSEGPYEKGKFPFKYGSETYDFDIFGTVFYGPDIKRGIALAAIRELRCIGGEYQQAKLGKLTKEELNATLLQLFRVEAKVPSLLRIDDIEYTYSAPLLMQAAIETADTDRIKQLLAKGMPVDDTLAMGLSAACYTCSLQHGETVTLLSLFHQLGAKLANDKTTAAHAAATHGNTECLEYCLEHGISLDAVDAQGRTIFSYACQHAQVKVIDLLAQKGVIPVSEDIFQIVGAGHIDILEKMFTDFPKNVEGWINSEDNQGNTLIHMAAKHGFTGIITYLLKKGMVLNNRNHQGQIPLHSAVRYGQLEVIAFLIKNDIDINQSDNDGNTPLHVAAVSDESASLILFLQNNADPNIPNADGNMPIHLAVMHGNEETADILLTQPEVEIHSVNNDGNGLLHLAAGINQYVVLKKILARLSEIDKENNAGETAFHRAINSNHLDNIFLLLRAGADPFKPDKQGVTPLHRAALKCSEEVFSAIYDEMDVKKLTGLINGMQPLGDDSLKSALLTNFARTAPNPDPVRKLLEKNADPASPDLYGGIPLFLALSKGNIEVLRLFLEKKDMNVNIKNQDGFTLLQAATESGHGDIVALLLSREGIDYAATNHEGRSALDIAIINKHNELVGIFLDHGIFPPAQSIYNVIQSGNLDLMNVLLDKYVIPTQEDENHLTAFHVAAKAKREDFISLFYQKSKKDGLLSHFIGNRGEDEWDNKLLLMLFIEAHKGNDKEIMNLLVEKGVNLDWAVLHDNINAARVLLKLGENPYVQNTLGSTALHLAASSGRENIVRLFLNMKDKNINVEDNQGKTPLHDAVGSSGTDSVVRLLIKLGADVNHATRAEQKTPLQLAASAGMTRNISSLLEAGADVNQADREGNTAIHLAVLSNQYIAIQRCAKAGGDVNKRNASDFSPAYLACTKNEKDFQVLSVLVGHGANIDDEKDQHLITMARNVISDRIVSSFFFDSLQPAGLKKIIKLLNETDEPITTLLIDLTIKRKYVDLFNDLIRMIPDINAEDAGSGRTYLQKACLSFEASPQIIATLLDQGADPNHINSSPTSPEHTLTALSLAIGSGNIEIAKMILDSPKTKTDIELTDKNGETALHHACNRCNGKMIKMLLKKGANVTATSNTGLSPLYYAVTHEDTDTIKLLMERGADPFVTFREGFTVFDSAMATLDGESTLIPLLFELSNKNELKRYISGVNIKPLLLSCLLKVAIEMNNTDIIQIISERDDVNIDQVDLLYESNDKEMLKNIIAKMNPDKLFLIHLFETAVVEDDIEFVQLLYDKNDNLLSTNTYDADPITDVTPLHLAADLDRIESVKFLLKKGMDPDIANPEGYTPLHLAARYGYTDVVRTLLKAGARPDPETSTSLTPLVLGCIYEHLDTVETLLEKGADLHQINPDSGYSLLHFAAYYNHPKLAKKLIEKGINPMITDKHGATALHYATHKKVAKILLACDLDPTQEDQYNTPLEKACDDKNHDLVELYYHSAYASGKLLELIERLGKGDYDENFLLEIFTIAVNENHAEITQPILSITSHETKGRFLDNFIDEKNAQGIEFLLKNGVDPYNGFFDSDGNTPFAIAIKEGKNHFLRIVLKNGGINPNEFIVLDNHLAPPLIHAILHDHAGIIKVLLEYKANPDITLYDQKTALELALDSSRDKIAITLIKGGADFISKGKEGISALERAIQSSQWQCVITMLLRLDSDKPLSLEVMRNLSKNKKVIKDEFVNYMFYSFRVSDPKFNQYIEMIHPEQKNMLASLFNKTMQTPERFHANKKKLYDVILSELNIEKDHDKNKPGPVRLTRRKTLNQLK